MVNLWMELHYSTEMILEILITRGNGMKKSIGNANVKIEDFLLSMECQEYGYIFDFSSISTIAGRLHLQHFQRITFGFLTTQKIIRDIGRSLLIFSTFDSIFPR